MKNKLEIITVQNAARVLVSARWLSENVAWVHDLLTKEKLTVKARRKLSKAQNLTVVFVGLAEGRKLNRVYRGRDYATDVLSFAPVDFDSLGELVFCVPVLQNKAREHHLTTRQELYYLLIHGILHLLDYDHEKNDKAAQAMYRLQDRIFEKVLHGHRHRIVRRKK